MSPAQPCQELSRGSRHNVETPHAAVGKETQAARQRAARNDAIGRPAATGSEGVKPQESHRSAGNVTTRSTREYHEWARRPPPPASMVHKILCTILAWGRLNRSCYPSFVAPQLAAPQSRPLVIRPSFPPVGSQSRKSFYYRAKPSSY